VSIRTFDGQWLLAGDGIATSDDCCCGDGCCTAGDTQYAPGATVSVTEDISGCGDLGHTVIIAPDLPMISCGVFEGPGTISGEETVVYKAIYNGNGTWQTLIDDVSDNFFLAVPIPETGGNTVVAFPCANDLEGPLDRSSDVTITVTGVCEQGDDPP
jgi:hypothetical protein